MTSLHRYDGDYVEAIKEEIRIIALHEADYYVGDNRKYKLQLLQILWFVEDALAETSHYPLEEEWYEQREKEQMLQKLIGKDNE